MKVKLTIFSIIVFLPLATLTLLDHRTGDAEAQTLPTSEALSTGLLTYTIHLPLVLNVETSDDSGSAGIRITGDLETDTYQYLSTVMGGGFPPTVGFTSIVSNQWLGDNTINMNLFYHPQVDLMTRYAFYEDANQFEYLHPVTHKVLGTFNWPDEYKPFIDLHDIQFSPDGSRVAVTIYKPTDELYEVHGRQNIYLLDFIMLEMNWPEMDEVTAVWHGSEHWDYRHADFPLSDEVEHYDYAHVNSIQYHPTERQMLISSRHLNEVTNIDIDTGEILWRLGGEESTFTLVDDDGFSYQHCAGYTQDGVILFDNANNTGNIARAVEYKLNHETGEATKVLEYMPGFSSEAMGCVYRYEDGQPDERTLIGWGICRRNSFCPLFTLLDANGLVLGQAFVPQDAAVNSSYRTTRMPMPQ